MIEHQNQFLPNTTRLSSQEILYLNNLTVSDLEAIRLALEGDSVIDWFRLDFKTDAKIDQFLKVNGYDLKNVHDQNRIEKIYSQAIAYVDARYPQRLPEEFRTSAMTIQQLLYSASHSARRIKAQFFACLILKIMHTINHLDARELMHRIELPASEIYREVEKKIEIAIKTMKDDDFHIVDFYGSHKDKQSMVTKLLAKKENHAAAIYDKIRFRIVTRTLEDILPVLYFLGRTTCPFNYIIPGSSHNNLISFVDLIRHYPSLRPYADFLCAKGKNNETPLKSEDNFFSSQQYRSINIVSDIPIRVDHLLDTINFSELGRLIFIPVEFQIMDQETYHANETGEGNHQKYKQRQMDAVSRRLGMDFIERGS